jgi:hypothetical protein
MVLNSGLIIRAPIPLSDTAPSTQAHSDSAAAGTGTSSSRDDHKHAMPASGGAAQATQAALEAETNEDTYAPPDLIKHSPGVAKVWVRWEQTGAHSILASYNMTSVTDGGAAGDTDHLWDTDFSGTEYVLTSMSREDRVIGLTIGSLAATGVTTLNPNLAGTAFDSNDNMMAGFGDQ